MTPERKAELRAYAQSYLAKRVLLTELLDALDDRDATGTDMTAMALRLTDDLADAARLSERRRQWLIEVQWGVDDTCSGCGALRKEGHEVDCALRAVIGVTS